MEKDFIAKRYSDIRLAHHISARALSFELGQSSQYINQIECGRKLPSLEGLLNFCDYFNITPNDFFNSEITYPVQYKSIINDLNKLDTEELEIVSNTIKLIAQNKTRFNNNK